MRRAGFTLIEILIVVGIIAIMLASAVMSVASGRGAVRVKEATRGVMQLSRYASALALLRQRPVVVTYYRNGKVEVRISGETVKQDDVGEPSDPIYREVDGQTTLTASEQVAEDEDAADGTSGREKKDSGKKDGEGKEKGGDDEKKAPFFTRQVLDPEVLAKEDADGNYEGVTFKVEVLGEDGEPLDDEVARALSLPQPKREKKVGEDGEPVEDTKSSDDESPISVTYETNGNVNPYRITVRQEGESEAEEGFVINFSRSGKASVDDIEEEREGWRARRRRRR